MKITDGDNTWPDMGTAVVAACEYLGIDNDPSTVEITNGGRNASVGDCTTGNVKLWTVGS